MEFMEQDFERGLDIVEEKAKEWGVSFVHRWQQYGGGGGVCVFFDNGYAVDVALHNGSYGNQDLKYEIAVCLHENNKITETCYYGQEIQRIIGYGDSVVGWLTIDEVEEYVKQVKKLPTYSK